MKYSYLTLIIGLFAGLCAWMVDGVSFWLIFMVGLTVGFFLNRADRVHLQNRNALDAASEKLEDLYANAPVGIFTSTVEGSLVFANEHIAQMMGARSAAHAFEVVQNVSDLYVDPQRRGQFIEVLKEQGSVVDFESELKGIDGKLRNVLFAARLKKDDGSEPYIEGFAMDVTQSRAAERENRLLQKKLSKAQHFKSITVLAGGIAHEFNNILQGMMGSAYLAQVKVADEEGDVQKYLNDIQKSGRRAAKLCDQMLSYAGKKEMVLSPQSPDACVENTLQALNMNSTFSDASLQLEKSLNAPTVKVSVDLPALSDVINQLIVNAVESLSGEGGRIQVESVARVFGDEEFQGYQMYRNLDAGPFWMLKVIDNGQGIDPEVLTHIFEPFYTTKFMGRGLGLPSTAGLVEKFNGSLGVSSTPSKGTEIVLWLPLVKDEEQPPVVDEEVKLNDEKLAGSGKIWVVDDEALICLAIERVFKRVGFEVGVAYNGVQGLEGLKADLTSGVKVQCVILDVTMPEMGGLEMLHYLRALDADLPVLLMSGFDESDSVMDLKNLAVNGFIHKPFRMEAVEAKVQKLLNANSPS